MSANEHTAKWRAAHHKELGKLFHVADGLGAWRKLVRIERAANKAACDYCNGAIDGDEWDRLKTIFAEKVARVSSSGKAPKGFFINGDPRGYTLKIESETAKKYPGLQRDWGGYGCLAAQID